MTRVSFFSTAVNFKCVTFLKMKPNFSRIMIKFQESLYFWNLKCSHISEHLLIAAITGSIIKYQVTDKYQQQV